MYKSRSQYERNLHCLTEAVMNQKIRLHPNIMNKMMKNILKARYSPNNRIDLLTINQTIRMMANMVGNHDSNQ